MKKRIVQSALLLAVIGAVAGSAAVFGGSATSSPDATTTAKLRYRYQHKALSPSSEEAAHLALLLDRVKAKRNVVNAGGAPIGPPPSTVSLFSVTAFATAGPLEQVEQTQTGVPQNALYVMRTVDVSPPFDTTLGGTTGVRLVYFTATRNAKPNLKKKVLVKWKTGAEPDTVGFRLYRQVGTKKTRIGRLFVSKGATGGVYSYTDTLPKTVAKACYAVDSVSGNAAASLLGKACMKK